MYRRAIGLDPDVYPEPTAFKPDRWLDVNGRVRDDLTYFTYGFGRRYVLSIARCEWSFSRSPLHRVCPGQHLANK